MRLGCPGVIDDLRVVFLSSPSDDLVRRHLADMLVSLEATRVLSRTSRHRRRWWIGTSLAVGTGLFAGAGVAAAAGELPDPLQDAVAAVVEPFGFDLPTGNADEAPGRGGANPGRSDEAPGQQRSPGNSENAPGHGGQNPGRSETAPGHSGAENNRPAEPPGLSEDPPGAKPAAPPGLSNGNGPPADRGNQGQGSGTPGPSANANPNANGNAGPGAGQRSPAARGGKGA